MKLALFVAALASSIASSASEWHPPASLPAAQEAAKELPSPPPVGADSLALIPGVPEYSPNIDARLARYKDFRTRIVIQGDLVKAIFEACESLGTEDKRCEELSFAFPSLRVDRASGKIRLGDLELGKLGNGVFTGPRVTGPWKLKRRVDPEKPDWTERSKVELWIERERP